MARSLIASGFLPGARTSVFLSESCSCGSSTSVTTALAPLIDTLKRDVMASDTLHGDDTPVAVLASGSGRTKTGRFWVYVRDERPHHDKRPPAAVFFYSPDRKAGRPMAQLKDFTACTPNRSPARRWVCRVQGPL